ncbi:acyltransferase [Pseudomonas helleri]|uniref:acyltransferase n=1 Tax=Pseudomonas helleri TaxID=1608996 RepID=UPI001885F8A4|nr:acyltransferase [Pseudomonas helleri]
MHPAKIISALINRISLICENTLSTLRIQSNKVTHGNNLKVTGLIYISNQGTIKIGNNVTINSSLLANPISSNRCSFATTSSGSILISDNVGLSGVTLYSAEKIEIGENSYIGAGVKILDTDFHSLSHSERFLQNDNNIQSKEIIISKNCFIGTEAIILKGVKIGSNAVIAAGSVVVTNVPENEIWGGVPARYLKKNTL